MGTFNLTGNWELKLYELGLKPEHVLMDAKLPSDLFSQSNMQITEKEYLWLLDAMHAQMRDTPFGLKYIQHVPVEAYSPAVLLALSCKNFNAALQKISQYRKLFSPLHIRIETNSIGTVVEIERIEPGELPSHVGILKLCFFTHLLRTATKKQLTPLWVSVPEMPNFRDEYEQFFGVKLRRGASYAIAFTANDASRAHVTANDELKDLLSPSLQQQLEKLEHTETTKDRVRDAIHANMSNGALSIKDIANIMGIGVRSLQRQLTKENVTFKQILDNTREKSACYYLVHTKMTASEIAFNLGYDDATSFFRVFKNWTGQTPGQYRKSHASISAPKAEKLLYG